MSSFTPRGDQEGISSYIMNGFSSRKVTVWYNFKFWELRWRNVWKIVCTIDICIVKVSTELCLCLYVFQNLALSCQISRWLLCNLWCSCLPEFVSFHLGTFPSPKGERLFLRLIIIKYNSFDAKNVTKLLLKLANYKQTCRVHRLGSSVRILCFVITGKH